MAYKIFNKALMASEDVQSYCQTGKFCTGTDADPTYGVITDGELVVRGSLSEDVVFAGLKDMNAYRVFYPTAETVKMDELWIADCAGIPSGVIGGNVYRAGVRLIDLQVAAGECVRIRKLKAGDTFWLGEGNFESKPTVGQYAKLTANKGTLTPAAAVTEGQANFKIADSKPLVMGTTAYSTEYLVEVL